MKKRLLFLILNYFAWLPLFIIQKPWFMTYNHPSTGNCSLTDGWKVILHGLKLDCTVAGYLTIIPLLMTLLSTWIPGKWYKKGIYAYTIMALLLITAIFSVDVALYSFWGFRIDSTLFRMYKSKLLTVRTGAIGQNYINLWKSRNLSLLTKYVVGRN